MTLDMNEPPRNENNAVVGYKIQTGRQDRAARTCASRHHIRRCRGGRPAEERMALEAADDKTSLLAQLEAIKSVDKEPYELEREAVRKAVLTVLEEVKKEKLA